MDFSHCLRRQILHAADLPEQPCGWGRNYEPVHEWLADRLGSPLSGRWYLLCAAFVEAWGAVK